MTEAGVPSLLQWIDPLNDLARLRVLRGLNRHELGVGELATALQLPQSTVSRHLKRLLDAGWITRRSQGTAALYRMAGVDSDPTARTLWELTKASLETLAECRGDDQRVQGVLARRSVDSRGFFGDLGGAWTDLRQRLFGRSASLHPLLALINPDWIVGDLGCGTGQTAAELACWVHRVEAIDREAAMLKAARTRLAGVENVGLHKADVLALPFDDQAFDASLLSLILHHLEHPGRAIGEAARVTRGPLLVVDMMAHDRLEYRDTMGHLHLGFTEEALRTLGDQAGVRLEHFQPLPPDPEASGPPLFVARLSRR